MRKAITAWLVISITMYGFQPSEATDAEEGGTRAELRFERTVFGAGNAQTDREAPGCLHVTLTDPDENAPDQYDEVVISIGNVQNDTLRDRETFFLEETDLSSGEFAGGCYQLAYGSALHDNGVIEVEPGSHIVGVYEDPDNPQPTVDEDEIAARAQELLESLDIAYDTAVVTGFEDFEVVNHSVEDFMADAAIPIFDGDEELAGAAVLDPGGVLSQFPDDRVLLGDVTPPELADFLEQWDGEVVDTMVVPQEAGPQPEPPALEYHVVRVNPPALLSNQLSAIAETLGGGEGDYAFSSSQGRNLMTLVLLERLGGRQISLDLRLMPQAPPQTREDEPGFQGWFATNDVNVAEAITYLDVIDRNHPGSVDVAVIDSGFAGPGDYSSGDEFAGVGHPDFGPDFNAITQADCTSACRAGPGRADGESAYGQCAGGAGAACDWHGTGAYSVVLGVADNDAGALGVAGHARGPDGEAGEHPLGRPILAKVGSSLVSDVARAINWSVDQGADVINISAGVPCEPIIDIDFCSPATKALIEGLLWAGVLALITGPAAALILAIAVVVGLGAMAYYATLVEGRGALRDSVARAHRRGVTVVASGPEKVEFLGERGPFNASDIEFLPCVIEDVICVGMINDDRVPDETNPFGNAIDIWAPGRLGIMRTPAGRTSFSGTSAAAPFIAGVVTLMKAARPSIAEDELQELLRITSRRLRTDDGRPPRGRCVTAGGRCVGFVDALAAVREAAGASSCNGFDASEVAGNDIASPSLPPISFPVGPPGAVRTLDLPLNSTLHSIRTDHDFFRLRPVFVSDVFARFTPVPRHGGTPRIDWWSDRNLDPSVVDLRPMSGPEVNLRSGEDAYVRALAVDHRDDVCYDVSLETIKIPQRDLYEFNNEYGDRRRLTGWTHEHMACGRASGSRRDCSAIFHDRTAAAGSNPVPPSEATERWTVEVSNLTRAGRYDPDFFSIELPDPRSLHPDLRGPGSTEAEPMPLRECGDYEVRDRFLGGSERITTRGKLTIRAIPEGNALSEKLMSDDGQIHLYVNGAQRDSIATGFGLHRTINCPRDALSLSSVDFSVNEEEGESYFDTGGYRLLITYEIEIHRSPDQASYRFYQRSDFAGGMGCLSPSFDFSAAPKGADLGTLPRDDFPYCRSAFGPDVARINLAHPFDPQRGPTCVSCKSLYAVRWGQKATLQVGLHSFTTLNVRLLDQRGTVLASTRSIRPIPREIGVGVLRIGPPGEPRAAQEEGTLLVPDLDPGNYFMEVEGPTGVLDVSFVSLRDPPDLDGDGIADAWDLCHDAVEDLDGWGDHDGCPDPDNDQDGVGDLVDNCPIDPNPNQSDVDRDGRGDVCDEDDDGDGLSDALELEHGTDPARPDTDGDGLPDGREVLDLRTDPLDRDTDGDLFADGTEVARGSDPLNPLSIPTPAGTVTVTDEPPVREMPVTDGMEPIG